jgi:iron complex transport system ATP-binding protein
MQAGLLQVASLRFLYDQAEAWSLCVEKLVLGGERMICLVGPNGSGKSTLLRLLAGILVPQEGQVQLAGRDMKALSRGMIARKIGYLPQETPALFDLTIDEVVMMGRYVHGTGWGGVTARDLDAVSRALVSVDLLGLRKRRLSQISGGERQRALIASVLAQEPEILLLDEPTCSLDLHHAVGVMRLLAGFQHPEPVVIVVTHDINLASLFADRMLLMDRGRIVCDGAPDAVVRAEHIAAVYGDGFLLERHPQASAPLIVPMRRVVSRGMAEGDAR